MKLLLSFIAFAIAGILALAPAAMAAQQGEEMERGQKARPDPVGPLMFIMDVPNIPAQEPPLMLADATTTQGSAQQYDRVIGVCHLSENPFVPQSAANVLSPLLAMKNYFRVQEHYSIEGQFHVSVLQMPGHGELADGGDGDFVYYPESGFIGNDRVSLLVEVDGKKIRMEYFFRVMQTVPEAAEGESSIYEQGYCPKKARVWKISTITDTQK